eukprot:jgi/Undpi1/12930/HiC_scaffold_7.g02596.m1
MKTRQRRLSHEREKAREQGWDSTRHTKLKEYNALFDPNMRHFFETPSVQEHLLKTGQIDLNGRVIDIQKQKGKLHIIEQEFKQAERIEYWRQKEERDMRERVQKKRALALERARKEDTVMRLHEDRKIRQEIVRACLEAQGGSNLGGSRARAQTSVSGRRPRATRLSRSQGHPGVGRLERTRGYSTELSSTEHGGCSDHSSRTFVTEGGGFVGEEGLATR